MNLKDDCTEELIAEAVKEARDADYVNTFTGGLNKSNGQDRGPDRKGLACPTVRMLLSPHWPRRQESDCCQHFRQRHCHAVGERGACYRSGTGIWVPKLAVPSPPSLWGMDPR